MDKDVDGHDVSALQNASVMLVSTTPFSFVLLDRPVAYEDIAWLTTWQPSHSSFIMLEARNWGHAEL